MAHASNMVLGELRLDFGGDDRILDVGSDLGTIHVRICRKDRHRCENQSDYERSCGKFAIHRLLLILFPPVPRGYKGATSKSKWRQNPTRTNPNRDVVNLRIKFATSLHDAEADKRAICCRTMHCAPVVLSSIRSSNASSVALGT
jgi:hypothetical protein